MFRKFARILAGVAVGMTILAQPLAQAGGCGTPYGYGGSYSYTYATPYTYREYFVVEKAVIAVPALFFSAVPTVPLQAAVTQPVVTAPTGTAAPAQAKTGPKETESERIDRLVREGVEKVLREMAQGQDDGPPAVKGLAGDPPPVQVSELNTRAHAILNSRCASCHSAPSPKKNIQIFNAQGELALNVAPRAILDAVNNGTMPPAAKGNLNHPAAVPAAERQVLQQWALQQGVAGR